jgi:hypothetical protein
MVYVDKIELEGVTGSLPARREHYEQLKKRKLEKNDFDTIVIQRIDRATRGGGDFGIWLETELKLCGIRVRFVGEDLPVGRHSSMIKMYKYEAAKDTAMGTSQRTAQGQLFAIEKGTLKTTGPTPYGTWRIYFSQTDHPSHIIRDCGNGLQEKLDPHTLTVLDIYGTTGKKSYGRYRKQKSETALLRPGDADEIRIVRVIFFLWFRWGWKGKRIASLLNKRGVPSPRGLRWSQRQVESVVENEAYTGITFNGESFSGIYNRRKKGRGFEALNRDEMVLLTRRTMPKLYVPLEERYLVEHSLMVDYLPPHVRRMAVVYHKKLALSRIDPMRGKRKQSRKTKFPNSDYWLSGFMVAKQDGGVYVGQLCGRKGAEQQYYRRQDCLRGYQSGDIRNRMFPMLPLHKELCRLLAECLRDVPDLRERLSAMIHEQRAYAEKSDQSLEALLAEREDIRERTLWFSRQSAKAREDAAPELARLDARRDELDALIARYQSDNRPLNEPIDKTIDRAIARCRRLADELPNLPPITMRELVRLFFAHVEADMETKDVAVSIALPKFVLEARKKPAGVNEVDQTDLLSMCVGTTLRSPASSDTHRSPLRICEAECDYVHARGSHQPVCYQCRRRAA